MAYTPTLWATGDVITAEKLNNMEQGIQQGMQQVYFVHGTLALDAQTATLDKTFAEMSEAVSGGAIIIAVIAFATGVTRAYYMSGITLSGESIADITCSNVGSDEGDLWVTELSLSTGSITTPTVVA